uniref:hypothetical protein n=1 Tax=Acinetobacter ursingii TaxID=108980 RepID=UPI00300AADFE
MAAVPAAYAAWAAVAATAVSAYATYESNETKSDQAQADADAAAAQGRLEAERIRKQKERVQSAARAAAAENGIAVNEGTAVTINDQIERDGQYDAAMSEIGGFNASQRLQAEASVHRKNANTAAITGALDTTAAAGKGYNSYKNGWK